MSGKLGTAGVLILAVPFLLAGCASAYDPTPDIFDVSVSSLPVVKADIADCARYASHFKRPFSVVSGATAAGQGAASNLSTAAVGGFVGPLLGGVGGFLSSLAEWLGVTNTDQPKAEQECLFQRFSKDHAGTLVEPPL